MILWLKAIDFDLVIVFVVMGRDFCFNFFLSIDSYIYCQFENSITPQDTVNYGVYVRQVAKKPKGQNN